MQKDVQYNLQYYLEWSECPVSASSLVGDAEGAHAFTALEVEAVAAGRHLALAPNA